MKKIFLYIMILFYAGAGVNHFVHPSFYLQIMPAWLPWHSQLVFISGVAEVVCALLLLFAKTRRIGAWAVIALLIAVFPANIQMLIDYVKTGNPMTWVAIVRLPIQLLLIWWAFIYTKPAPLPDRIRE
jgi:uncharacterized membrane protein